MRFRLDGNVAVVAPWRCASENGSLRVNVLVSKMTGVSGGRKVVQDSFSAYPARPGGICNLIGICGKSCVFCCFYGKTREKKTSETDVTAIWYRDAESVIISSEISSSPSPSQSALQSLSSSWLFSHFVYSSWLPHALRKVIYFLGKLLKMLLPSKLWSWLLSSLFLIVFVG